MSGRKGGLTSSSDSNYKYNPPRRTVSMSRIYELAQPRRRYLEEALKKRKNLNNLPHDQRNNAMTTSMVVSGTPGVVPSNSNDPMIKSMYDLPSSTRTPMSAGAPSKRNSAPVRRPFTMSNSRSRNVLAQTPEMGELNLTSNGDHIPHSGGLVKSRSTATFPRTGASSNIESNSESATSVISKSSVSRPKKGISKRREQQKEYENRRKEKEEREEELKMKLAEKEASDKLKRAKEERRKREAEEEEARRKAQQELADKLAREEEERRQQEEAEASKLANELKRLEEEKMLQAIEEQKRRQEEERKRQEEEARLTQEREEAEARIREEVERARVEREEKSRREEEERLERKKKVEAIMSRTRKTPTSISKAASDIDSSITPNSSLIVPSDQGSSSGVSSLTSRDSLTIEPADAPSSPTISSTGNGSISSYSVPLISSPTSP